MMTIWLSVESFNVFWLFSSYCVVKAFAVMHLQLV